MPGIKQRIIRRKKICPPHKRKAHSQKVSASRKKLVNSPSGIFSKKRVSKDSCQEGKKTVVLEKENLLPALESAVVCQHCLSGPVTFKEDKNIGLCTNPSLNCGL